MASVKVVTKMKHDGKAVGAVYEVSAAKAKALEAIGLVEVAKEPPAKAGKKVEQE